MDFELYHDESLVDGFWHGMLLVPIDAKQKLVNLLDIARTNSGYSDPIGIKSVRTDNRIFDNAKAWLTVGVASLGSHQKGGAIPIYLGKDSQLKPIYDLFQDRIGAKFILFRERDSLGQMTGHRDHGSRVETTFRMGFKGGLHYLGSDEEPIYINKLHFDGHEHLRRHVDKKRVIDRIQGLRAYCSIEHHQNVIDDRSSNHRLSQSQSYMDCQLLQLTDLLIGSFRSCLGYYTREIHKKLAYPVHSLVLRYNEGYARMRNSRWRNSFCLSECYLLDGNWHFGTLDFEENQSTNQLPLGL